jgi:hypothetical protein
LPYPSREGGAGGDRRIPASAAPGTAAVFAETEGGAVSIVAGLTTEGPGAGDRGAGAVA